MNYETAKKLKDAGFPNLVNHVFPTLSELIEACGKEFGSLVRMSDNTFSAACPLKQNEYFHQTRCDIETSFYPTPEEAVANLWLALHPLSTPKE